MVRTFLCQPLADPKVFSDEYEPTCCCCTSNGLILIASGASNAIHVYSALSRAGCRKVFGFQSIGTSKKLAHCSLGNYIASLECKCHETRGGLNQRSPLQFARVYVNWTKVQESGPIILQQRIGYTREPGNVQNCSRKFLAIDIPVKYSVNDISCCDSNGNIALSTEAKVYLYTYKEVRLPSATEDAVAIDFDCALEIDSGFQITQVALHENFIAFASHCEIRAIQVIIERRDSVSQAEDVSKLLEEDTLQQKPTPGESHSHCSTCQSITDESFVSWNIEKGCSYDLESLEHETITVESRKTAASSFGSPAYVVNNSCIKFEAVLQDPAYVSLENTAKEIVGPKENIKGHPLVVMNNFHDLGFVSVNHVTLLYRRFYNELTDMTADGPCIHSVQMLPIYADNTSSSFESSPHSYDVQYFGVNGRILLSLGLFFSTGRKGYLYDLSNTPRLLTEYNFTEACISSCLTQKLLHVITKNGLESYTVRLYASSSKTGREYQGQINLPTTDQLHEERRRTFSSLSYSSSIDFDPKSQSCEQVTDCSELEQLQPEESYFTKVQLETRTGCGKPEKMLSSRQRKKLKGEKPDQTSPSRDDESAKKDTITNFMSSFEKSLDILYSLQDVLQPCPPTRIEVCLIGIYPLRGFAFIGSTEKHVVLLQKTYEFKGKRGSLGKERVMPWNVYVREVVPAAEIYRDIINLIEGSEFANPSIFHQLLSEAHMILRADLTANTPEDMKKSIQTLIRRSAVKLGDFYSRCDNGFDVTMAKEYYHMTGIKLDQVLLRHAKRDKDENLGMKYGFGIIDFLNEKLLKDVNKSIQIPEDSIDQILKIYSVAAPQLLSTLILKSNVNTIIPAEKAIQLMEQFEQADESLHQYRLSSLDFVTMAVLHLRLCDPTHAEHDLRRLSDDQLSEAISHHPELVFSEGILTHLGQLLRRHFSMAYTNLLVLWYDNGVISLQIALNAYGVSPKGCTSPTTKPNYKLWEFLETLLNDEKRDKAFHEIMMLLLEQYTSWFEWKGAVALLSFPHQHIPKGNGHFAARFDWLDKLPPFLGESPVPQDCLLRRQIRSSLTANGTPDHSPKSANKPNEQISSTQTCSCCCCNSVLIKVQSLLCSQYCSVSTCEILLQFVERSSSIVADSTKLLCYPAVGKVSDAVSFVLANHPSIMLHYAKDVFKDSKSKWRIFLDCLLKTLHEDSYERWNKDTYLDALRGTLAKLARICKPSEFLGILPKDGTARFFLPFIQDCHQIHNAGLMQASMLQSPKTELAGKN